MRKLAVFNLLFLLSSTLFSQARSNLDGFLDIRWGDSFSIAIEKLKKADII